MQEERQALLAQLATSQLARIEDRVAYLLLHFPETRESDTALVIRYWRKFQADVIEAHSPLDLDILYDLDNLETITRCRRHIQNELGLWRGTRVRTGRDARQRELHEYLARRKTQCPDIRFYLDETGHEPHQTYTGIAGICVIDWRLFEMHHAALQSWRDNQNWADTLHFNRITDDISRHLALLGELQSRRAGLLFVGHAVQSRLSLQLRLHKLLCQLVRDSLHKIKEHGSLSTTRALTVILEANESFDAECEDEFRADIAELLATDFQGAIYLKDIEQRPKGREVLLECADMVASAMRRRTLYSQKGPKDELAEAVMNVTGFEDPADESVVYKLWPN